jgi:hypothetical protein
MPIRSAFPFSISRSTRSVPVIVTGCRPGTPWAITDSTSSPTRLPASSRTASAGAAPKSAPRARSDLRQSCDLRAVPIRASRRADDIGTVSGSTGPVVASRT